MTLPLSRVTCLGGVCIDPGAALTLPLPSLSAPPLRRQRKKIVPVLMEADYKPTGWLGALMGTRLYFNMSDVRQIPNKMGSLIKELGDAGR